MDNLKTFLNKELEPPLSSWWEYPGDITAIQHVQQCFNRCEASPEAGARILSVHPSYSAVLMGVISPYRTSEIMIDILGLDGYQMHIDSSKTGTSAYLPLPDESKDQRLVVGSILMAQLGAFMKTFIQICSMCKNRKERSNPKPPPHTPSFLHQVAVESRLLIQQVPEPTENDLTQAMTKLFSQIDYSRGFADRGVPVGDQPQRSMDYSLSLMCLRYVLGHITPWSATSTPDILYTKLVCRYELITLESSLHPFTSLQTPSESEWSEQKNLWMKMLCQLCRRCKQLSEKIRDVPFDHSSKVQSLFECCQDIRNRLNDLSQEHANEISKSYRLQIPPSNSTLALPSPNLSPQDSLQRLCGRVGGVASLSTFRSTATRNLNAIPVWSTSMTMPPSSTDITSIQLWLSLPLWETPTIKSAAIPKMIQIKALEDLIFGYVRQLPLERSSDTAPIITQIDNLNKLMDKYHSLVVSFQETPEYKQGLSAPSMASRYVLMLWGAFCLFHQYARHQYPNIIDSFHVSLSNTQLQHLVLSDADALLVASIIGSYLRHYRESNRVAPLFQCYPKEVSAMNELADDIMTMDQHLLSIWESVNEKMIKDQQKLSEIIRSKQLECHSLNRLIKAKQQEIEAEEQSIQADTGLKPLD